MAAEIFKVVGRIVYEGASQVANQLGSLGQAANQAEGVLAHMGQAANEVGDHVDAMGTAAIHGASQVANGMDNAAGALESLDQAGQAAENGLNQVEQGLNSAGSTANTAAARFQQVGDRITGIGEGMQNAGGSMTEKITLPLAALGGAAMAAANSVQSGTGKIQASLGVTKMRAEDLEGSARNLWKNGFGADMAEASDAIITVGTNLKDLSPAEIEKVTEQAFILKDAFGAEIADSTKVASTLMKNFGIDSTHAMDLMTVGFQKGGDYSGELLDTLNEYSPQFASMGFSADDFMNTLLKGSQAGAFSLDKVGDSMKEFNIRAQDGSKTTAAGFSAIGLDADKMGAAIAGGGQGAQNAFMATTAALAKMKDPMAQNAAGVALFGTQWEDVKAKVVLAMGDSTNALGDVKGATDEAGKSLYDNFGSRLQTTFRTLQDSLVPLGMILLNMADAILPRITTAVQSVANWFNNLSPAGQKIVVTIGLIAAAVGPMLLAFGGLLIFVGRIISSFSQIRTAFSLLRGAMLLFSGPVGIAIAIIMGLVAVGILVYKNWATVKAFLIAIWNGISTAAIAVWSGLTSFFSGVINGWRMIFIAVWTGIKTGLINAWNGIKFVAIAVWNGLGMFFRSVLNGWRMIFIAVWTGIKTGLIAAWNGIKFVAVSVWNGLGIFFRSVLNGWKIIFVSTWNGIKAALSAIWNGAKAAAVAIWNGLKSFFSGLWNGIRSGASSAWNAIKSTVTSLIRSAVSTAESLWNGLKSKVSSIFSSIKSAASSAWNGIKSAIMNPINSAVSGVSGAISRIKGFFSGLRLKLPNIPLPHFSLSGEFSLKKMTVPHLSVDWYDKGGIFDRPSIIGVGEKRPEFVGALDDLRGIVTAAMGDYNGPFPTAGGDHFNFVIDLSNVRELNDLISMAQDYRQTVRKGGR